MVTKDVFGLPMKYKRKVGGQQYFIPNNLASVGTDGGRILIGGQGGSVSKKGNFFVLSQNSQVRFGLCQSNGYKSSSIETDRETLIQRGYMQDSNDWGGAYGASELTFSWRYMGGGSNDPHVTIYMRGGRHSDDNKCEGSAYKGTIFCQSGTKNRISKEDWHPNYDHHAGTNNYLPSDIEGLEIMQKLCIYNLGADMKPILSNTNVAAVKIELWACKETTKGSGIFNDLVLLQSIIDNGENMGDAASDCGNVDDKVPMSWNGPIAVFRWDDDPEIEWRNMSCVDIDPTTDIQDVPEGGNPNPPPPPPTGGDPNPPPSTDPNVSTTGELMHDAFGIVKLYQSKVGGSSFIHSPDGLLSSKQFLNDGATKVGNGWYHMSPSTTRMEIFSTEADQARGAEYENYPTYDFDELAISGSWGNPTTDWHNIEWTIYFRNCKKPSPDHDDFSLVSRSVRHEETSHGGCGGSSYHNNISFTTGLFRYKKEQRHVNYDTKAYNSNGIGSIVGSRTFGIKAIICDIEDGKAVKLETWADKDNNNKWVKYHELTDRDDWGDDMKTCGATKQGQRINWGSPKLIIKANQQDFEFGFVSVREIVSPPTLLIPAPIGGGGGTGGGGTGGGGTGGGGTGGGGTGGGGTTPPPPPKPIIIYAGIKQSTLDNMTMAIGTELVQTLVNPDWKAKFGTTGWQRDAAADFEIGDVPCRDVSDQAVFADGLKVRAYWSNDHNNCVIPTLITADLGTSAAIVNHLGRTLPNATIYMLFWGQDWSVGLSSPTASQLINAVRDKFLNSDKIYFNFLTQYGGIAYNPVWGKEFYNTAFPAPFDATITTLDVESVLRDSFEEGIISIPQADNTNIYLIMLPTGKNVINSTTDGMHDNFRPTLVPPPTGGTGGSTGNVSRINTRIVYMWDHVLDASGFTCSGAGAGVPPPPPGTYTSVMSVSSSTADIALSGNFSGQNDRVRVMEMVNDVSSVLNQVKTTKFGARLKKVGSPTGIIYFEVYDNNRETPNVVATFGSMDVTTLTTSYVLYEFTKDDIATYLPNGLQEDYAVGVRYEDGSSSNYVFVAVNKSAPFDGVNSCYAELDSGGHTTSSSWDACFNIYKSP